MAAGKKEGDVHRLTEKNELPFALFWIFFYFSCLPWAKAILPKGSLWPALAQLLFAALLGACIPFFHLKEKTGLLPWPKQYGRRELFMPVFLPAAVNLLGGIDRAFLQGKDSCWILLSLAAGALIEELLFRGLLFSALRARLRPLPAIFLCALSFGAGHVLNLFSGQALWETLLQSAFAAVWGLILTLIVYRGGSLLPCILAHVLINISAALSGKPMGEMKAASGVTMLIGGLYALWLLRAFEKEGRKTGQ